MSNIKKEYEEYKQIFSSFCLEKQAIESASLSCAERNKRIDELDNACYMEFRKKHYCEEAINNLKNLVKQTVAN